MTSKKETGYPRTKRDTISLKIFLKILKIRMINNLEI
jgi:hypothetical protein